MEKIPATTPALLFGAGLSPGEPCAVDLVTPLIKLFAPEALPDIATIRFELFMQLIKDHLDPDLAFISAIYAAHSNNTHRYSELVSALISNDNFTAFTTNFDRNIENANVQAIAAAATRSPIIPIVRKEHFSEWLTTPHGCALFKLHGSADDPPSLAATYESVTWLERPNDPRAQVFERALSTQDLWVLGYSGYDDMDVVPTIVNTPAMGRKLIWFFHTTNRSGRCTGAEFLDIHDDIDPSISQRQLPLLNIIKSIAISGTRSLSDDVVVVYGDTEHMLHLQLEQFELSIGTQLIRTSHVAARELELKRMTSEGHDADLTSIVRKRLADNATRDWFSRLPALVKKKAPLVYANVVHTINYDQATTETLVELIETLKDELASDTSADARAVLISANASLVQLYYWLEYEPEEILKLRDECLTHLTELLVAPETQSLVAPERISQNIVSVLVWVAEQERFAERFESAQMALSHPYVVNPAELASQLTAAHSRHVAASSSDLSELLVARANAERMLTQADLFHATEKFGLAERCYRDALMNFDRVGDSYWRIYALDGIAATHWARGDLSAAERYINLVKVANSLSGYTSWNDKHPTIKAVDIARIRGGSRISIASQLEQLFEVSENPVEQEPNSESLLIDWMRLSVSLEHSVDNDLADIGTLTNELGRLANERKLAPINRMKAVALMSEHIVNHLSLREGSIAICNLLRQARDAKMSVTKLKLWLQLALLRLKFGQTRPRTYLARYCERHDFCLGAGWAVALTALSGHEVSSNDRRRWVDWAEDQMLPELCAALSPKIDKVTFVAQLRLRMPFGYH